MADETTPNNIIHKPKHHEELIQISLPIPLQSQAIKLKNSLENWKQLVLTLNNVALWKKQWHPTALIGFNTVVFMLIWLMEPSMLTILSILSLGVIISDFILPSFLSTISKSQDWTTVQEKEFFDVCKDLIVFKAKLMYFYSHIYDLKLNNSKMFFIVATALLIALAWIGSLINNLFLTYFFVTAFVLYPGFHHNGILKKWMKTLQEMAYQTKFKTN